MFTLNYRFILKIKSNLKVSTTCLKDIIIAVVATTIEGVVTRGPVYCVFQTCVNTRAIKNTGEAINPISVKNILQLYCVDIIYMVLKYLNRCKYKVMLQSAAQLTAYHNNEKYPED